MKKLLFLFAGCLLFAGANAQEESLYNEWFTDGGASQPLETEQIEGYDAAKIVISTAAANGDNWSVQFCNIFNGNKRQAEGRAFSITFDAKFIGGDDVEYATFYFLTGHNRRTIDGETIEFHDDYQWGSDNTELTDVYVNDSYISTSIPCFFAPFNVYNNDWTQITIDGTIGDAGADYIGIQFNLGGNADNAGTLYIRDMHVNIGGSSGTNLSYFGLMEIADDNFDYSPLSENNLAVTKFNNTEATTVTVPSTVTIGEVEYTVTAIGDEAFKDCSNLTSVTLPATITSIGDEAFSGCENLTNFTIPAAVQNIGSGIFASCSALTAITVDNGNNYWSAEDGVLLNKNKTVLKCCPAGKTGSFTVPSTVTQIASAAFYNCTEIEEVILPDGLTTIGSSAFYNCQSLESIIIPESVTMVDSYAFEYCPNLTAYCETTTPPSSQWAYRWNGYEAPCSYVFAYGAWNLDEDGVLTVSKCLNFEGMSYYPWYSYIEDITSVVIEDGVTCIGNYAFSGCSNLSSITIPDGVTTIGEGAFYECYSLTNITLPEGVTTIGYQAFYNCSNLETISIPNSITSIGSYAFNNCDNLTYNYDDEAVAMYLGNEDNPFLCLVNKVLVGANSVTVNDDCKLIASSALTYLTIVEVPETVEYIGSCAFSGVKNVIYNGSATGSPWCATGVNATIEDDFIYADEEKTILIGYTGSDTEIVIPSTVIEIGENAFQFSNVTSVDMSNATNLTNIGEYAFSLCQKLESVVFPESLETIGNEAFYNCQSLTAVTIPSGVVTIGNEAFQFCNYIETLDLSNATSLQHIGNSAFQNTQITEIVIPSSLKYIGNNAFFGNEDRFEQLATVDFSNATSLQTIGSKAFQNQRNLAEVDLSNATSLQSIGYGAFYNCSSLESIEIPGSVTSVNDQAFAYCSNLKLVTIPSSVNYLRSETFYGCDKATILCEAESEWVVTYYTYNWNYNKLIWNYKNLNVDAWANDDEYGEVEVTGESDHFEYGDVATLTATPAEGYQFVRWDDGNTDNPRTLTVDDNYDFVAIFADENATIYTLTINVNNPDYGVVYGAGRYAAGEYVDIIAYESDGCYFIDWTNGSTEYSDYYYSSIQMTDNITLTANFGIETYDITVNVNGNGTVTGAEDVTYNYGTEMELTAVPDEGYRFISWLYDGGITNMNPLTITATNDYEITANFTEITKEVFEGDNIVYSDGKEYDNCVFHPTETALYTIFARPYSSSYYSQCNLLDADKNVLVQSYGDAITYELQEGGTYYIGAGYQFDGYWGETRVTISKPLTISVTAENGTVYGLETDTFNYGDYIELYAEPDEGYKFVRWSGSWNSNSEDIDFEITKDMELEAIFCPEDQNLYTIETGNNSTPGFALINGNTTYIKCIEGENITLIATPLEGAHFSQWSDGNTDNPRELTVTEAAVITAKFEYNYYTVTVEASEGGYVIGGGSYQYGSYIDIAAYGNNYYCSFNSWSDGSTNNYHEVYITSDTTFTAYFDVQEFTVNAEAYNPAQGSVEGSGAYAYGSEVTLKATGATGYHFVEWSDGETDNPRTVTVNDYNNSYTAYFEINTYNVIADANLENGSITGIGTYTHGQEATFKAVPVGGYKFVRWSNLGTEDEFTTTVTGDMTLSAVFCEDSKDVFEVTVKTAGGRGTVTGASMYVDGEKATFTASPDEGYHFTYWNDDKDATEPTLKKTITKEQTITAHFEKNTYAVAISAGENGTVTAKLDNKDFVNGTVEHGDEITLKATANANYHFAGWSDGNNDAERTISVTKDLNLTANFAKDTYTLSIKATNGTIKGNGTFEIGESVTITAEPAFGYKFVRWSDGNTDNPRTVTITAELINTIDESFTAVFEEAGNATAIEDEVAAEINIYAYGNTIVVENATSDIDVYSAMGQLVSRTTANGERNVITVNGTGIYIVRTGNVAKRVMLQ